LEDTNSGAKNPSQSIYNQPVLEPNEDEIEEANQGFMEGEQDFDGIKPEALEK
jgi:hypothetical protein